MIELCPLACVSDVLCTLPTSIQIFQIWFEMCDGERKSGLKPGQSTAIAFCVPDLCVSAEALFYLIPDNFMEIVLTFLGSLFRELLRDTHSFDHSFIPQS